MFKFFITFCFVICFLYTKDQNTCEFCLKHNYKAMVKQQNTAGTAKVPSGPMSIPSSLLISLLVPTVVPALHGSLLKSVWVCLLQNCIQSHRAAHIVLLLRLHLM